MPAPGVAVAWILLVGWVGWCSCAPGPTSRSDDDDDDDSWVDDDGDDDGDDDDAADDDGTDDDAADDDGADDDGADDDGADDDGADDDGADDDASETVDFSGTVVQLDVDLGVPEDAEALTIAVADPAPALAGGEPEILAFGEIEPDGEFLVAGVDASAATLGALVLVEGPGYVPMATGVPYACYGALPPGGTCEGLRVYAADQTVHGHVVAGVRTAGWDGTSLVDAGALVGFVTGPSGIPLSGATVLGPAGVTTYYADLDLFFGDPSLGFVGATGPNTSTSAVALGAFVTPEATLGSYDAQASGHDFETLFVGSFPGTVLVVTFAPE